MFKKLVENAKTLAVVHKGARYFHVTFILLKNKVLAVGINQPHKTHPRNLRYDYENPSLKGTHSELSAIIRCGDDDCSRYTFVNIKIDRNGKVALSKPCMGCRELLLQVGFRKVYYSNNDGTFTEWKTSL